MFRMGPKGPKRPVRPRVHRSCKGEGSLVELIGGLTMPTSCLGNPLGMISCNQISHREWIVGFNPTLPPLQLNKTVAHRRQ